MASNFDLVKFKNTLLEEINALRKEHGAPSLNYSDKLEASAMDKAKDLLNDETSYSKHAARGVNDVVIQLTTNMEIKPSVFINNFKENGKDFDYKEGKYVEKAGGFTQAIWVNTREFGVGYSCLGEKWFFVLRFYPYGNIDGRFFENVKPSGSEMSVRTNDGPIPLKSQPTPQELQSYFTNAHNLIRAKYGCDNLVWDNEIAAEASKAAEMVTEAKLKNSETPKLREDYGKNIAFSSSGIPPMDIVISKWYEGCKNFSYDTYECNETNGSFVQIVFKETTKFGVGVFTKDNNSCYVAFYHPRLVITEKFKDIFPKPVSEKEVVFEENP